ncbi:MAG: dihydroneopterin triphosphate diphosphatase [Rhodocyclaceae bacterium]|nr:dihydroneopterin triphosphate diphosphatase [Rhodocyclaceae bacterium]MBX3670329.1 dihydroneopterin triphosphate diphosphatase [Rhodocyclaceae bacterium]
MAHKLPRSVLVLIHSPAFEILLLERASHPGYWQSVTGSQETGETLRQTAQREVAEETGLVVAASALRDWGLSNRYEIFPIWRHRYAPGVTHNTEHVFSLCVPRDSPIRLAPAEHLAWRWLDRDAAGQAVFSWSNRDAILMLGCRGPYAAG